ncbi:helix-turn-helix domain-containing protein [Thaumasiovibrio sp. DFM-14]|uniref:helix-turn-helix domain-containing protein n=1 Tax=Thaumasiovibrio sp. DFM-14 TaxID=3384792 RepID=UPI00399F45CC
MKKKKPSAYSSKVLTKVQQEWNKYRSKHNITQLDAAKQIGLSQSAFSQYLRGGIQLNTDFLVRFAQLVGEPLANFHHRLDIDGEEWHSQDSTLFTVEVKQCLSCGKMPPKFVIMPRMTRVAGYLPVEIDNHNSRYKLGSIVVFGPADNISEFSEVGVFNRRNDIIAIGELTHTDGEWWVNTLANGIPTRLNVQKEHHLMRVEGTVTSHSNQGLLFKNR